MVTRKQTIKLLDFLTTLTSIQIRDIMESNEIWSNYYHDFKFCRLDVKNQKAVYKFYNNCEKENEVSIHVSGNKIIASL